eukprot:403340557
MQKFQLSIALVIITSLFFNLSIQQYCFAGNFPKLIGGANGEVRMTAIDIDSNKNIVVGGYTTDTTIAPASSLTNPSILVSSIDGNGATKFMKRVDGYDSVLALKYTRDNLEVFVLMDLSQAITFYVIDANSGMFRRAYQLSAVPVQISPSFAIDGNKRVFLAFGRAEGYLRLLKFDGGLTTSGNFVHRIEYDQSQESVINAVEFFDNAGEKQVIFGGYVTNSTGNMFAVLLNYKAEVSALPLNKAYALDLSQYGAPRIEVADIHSYYSPGLPHVYNTFGCMQYQSYNLLFFKFYYTANYSSLATVMYYYGSQEYPKCRGVYAKNENILYSHIFSSLYNEFKFVIVNITDPNLPTATEKVMTPLSGGQNLLTKSVFFNERNSYFTADIYQINFVNKNYGFYTGAIMSSYNGQSCIQHNLLNQSAFITYYGYFIKEFDSSSFNYVTSGVTYYNSEPFSLNDYSINPTYNSWCTQNIPLTYIFPTSPYYEYELYSGPQYYLHRQFYTVPYCEDAIFTQVPRLYYTQADFITAPSAYLEIPIPSWIDFNIANSSIKVDLSDQSQVMIYYFGIKSFLTQKSNYQYDQTEIIIIKNPCLLATVTPSAVTLQQKYYRMQNGTQTWMLPTFSFNSTVCEKAYELEDSTMIGTLDPLFSYDNTTDVYELTIDTDQVIATTVFSLIFKAYYVHSDHAVTVKTINLEITIYNCMDAQLTPPIFDNQIYNISDPSELLPLSAFTLTPTNYDCGSINYFPAQILPGSIETTIPTFISFDLANLNLMVQTDDVLKIGQYIIRIYGNATDFNIVNYYDFELKVRCLVRSFTKEQVKNQNYGIKENPLTFDFKSFIKYPNCPQAITYKAFEDGKSTLSGFIAFKASSRQFSVYSTNNDNAKKYDIIVRGQVTNPTTPTYVYFEEISIQLAVVSTTFQSTNGGAPTFKVPLVDQILTVNTFKQYNLPEVTDQDGDLFTIDVQMGQLSAWIEYTFPTFKISPGSKNNGTYSVKIILTDKNTNPMSSTVYLNVKVMTEEEAAQFDGVGQNGQTPTVIKTGFSPTLAAKLKSFDYQGYLAIQFTTDILLPQNISVINENALRLKIKPSASSSANDLAFTWKIKSLESNLMILYLNFTNPDAVSQKVSFTVIFVGNDQCHLDNFSFTIIQYKLPRKCQDALCFDYISVSI